MSIEKVSLNEKFARFDDHWSPKIIGALNGQHVKIAKLKGDFIWHHHEDEDELFLVINGILHIALKEKTLTLHPGEFVIIPKGVEHKPYAEEEVEVLLFEPATTLNTGNTTGPLTKHNLDVL